MANNRIKRITIALAIAILGMVINNAASLYCSMQEDTEVSTETA